MLAITWRLMGRPGCWGCGGVLMLAWVLPASEAESWRRTSDCSRAQLRGGVGSHACSEVVVSPCPSRPGSLPTTRLAHSDLSIAPSPKHTPSAALLAKRSHHTPCASRNHPWSSTGGALPSVAAGLLVLVSSSRGWLADLCSEVSNVPPSTPPSETVPPLRSVRLTALPTAQGRRPRLHFTCLPDLLPALPVTTHGPSTLFWQTPLVPPLHARLLQ